MKVGLIGKKVGMTQVFIEDKDGNSVERVPVTAIKVEPNYVIQVKKEKEEGANAVQLGSFKNKWYRCPKPVLFHVMKAFGLSKEEIEKEIKKRKSDKIFTFKVLKDFRVDEPEKFKEGSKLDLSNFAIGDKVKITGTSKGKGFQGVMKRWNFSGGPASHGSRFKRRPGAIGMCATPSRVLKGKKMPGRYGGKKVTLKRISIVDILEDKNVILVKGGVPGPKQGIIYIEKEGA